MATIRVKRLSDGKTGTLNEGDFNPTLYSKVSVTPIPTPVTAGMSANDPNNFKQAPAPVKESPSLLGFGANIFKSGVKTAKDIGSSLVNVFNPDLEKNTVANLGRLAIGTGELFVPGEQGAEKYARAVGKFYDDRYGVSNLLKGDIKGTLKKTGATVYDDPVGLALDASILMSGGAGAVSKVGVLTKSTKLAKTAEILNKASTVTNPLSAVSKIVGKAKVGEKVQKAGAVVEEGGTTFGVKAIKPGATDINAFKKTVGTALDHFQKENKLYGSVDQILNKTDDLITKSQEAYNALVRTGAPVKIKDFTNLLRDKAAELKSTGKISPEIQATADALIKKAKFMEDNAGKSGLVTTDQIATAKGASFTKVSPAKMQDAASMNADKYAGGLGIEFLDSYAPGSAAIGKKLEALRKFKEIVEKGEGKGVGSNSVLSVPRVAAAAGGAAVGSVIPGAGTLGGALVGLGIEEALKSPRGTSIVSQGTQKVGQAIQKVPAITSKITGKATSVAALTSRALPNNEPAFANGQPAITDATTGTPQGSTTTPADATTTPETKSTTITGHTLDEHAMALSKATAKNDRRAIAQIKAQMAIEADYQKRQTTGFSLSDAAIKNITDLQGALTDISALNNAVKSNEATTFPGRGLIAKIPWATKAKSLQAEVDRIRQVVGKALEGGVLRKEDEEKYKKILLTLDDPKEVALTKLQQLETKLTQDLKRYVEYQRLYGKGADQPATYQGLQFSNGQTAVTP